MSKTEMLKQSALASNETRLAHLGQQIETLRQSKQRNAEDLALMLEPLAQAMASLADEARQTLDEIERKSREQAEKFKAQTESVTRSWKDAAASTQAAADSLNRAGARMEWRHYALVVMTGLITAVLVSAFWLWLAPPTVQNQLDPKAVAEYLKPAVIEALKHSKGK